MKYGEDAPWPGWKYGAHKYRVKNQENGRASMLVVGSKGIERWRWTVSKQTFTDEAVTAEATGIASSVDRAVACAEQARERVEQAFAILKGSA